MLFGNCKINDQVQVKIDDVNIKKVHVNKILGVTIKHKICWKPHIKYVHIQYVHIRSESSE